MPAKSFCTDTGIFLDASIMSCDFKLLQRFDSEIVMEASRKFFSNARHRRKDGNHLAFAAKTIEHRQPAVKKDVANRPGNARTDTRDFLQSLDSFAFENISHRTRQTAKHVRGFAIRLNPKPICPLLGKNIRDFIEPACDVDIWARVKASANPQRPDFICLCHAFTLTQSSRHRLPPCSLGEKCSHFVIACL